MKLSELERNALWKLLEHLDSKQRWPNKDDELCHGDVYDFIEIGDDPLLYAEERIALEKLVLKLWPQG